MLLEPVFPSLPTEARSLYISPNLPAGSASPRREIEQGLAWLEKPACSTPNRSLAHRIAHTFQGGWGGPAAALGRSLPDPFFHAGWPLPGASVRRRRCLLLALSLAALGCWRRLCTVLCALRKTHPSA